MASAIERYLYGEAADLVSEHGEVGDYFVAELRLAEGLISLRIASDRRPFAFRWVHFREAALGSFSQNAAEPDDLLLPWSIAGFHSWEQADGFWSFNLICPPSRWSWDSHWPELEDA